MDSRPHVTIVCGPPCSGKSTHVAASRQPGDLLIDYDLVRSCLTGLPEHERPTTCESEIHWIITDAIEAMIRRITASRMPLRVWIVACLPDSYKRRNLAVRLRASVQFMDVSQEECLSRATPRGDADRWRAAIQEYFAYAGQIA
jgi:hypothetical protein